MPLASWVLIAALVVYGASTVIFIAHLLTKKPRLATIGLYALSIGVFVHIVGKVLRLVEISFVPVTDAYDAMSMLALLASVIFVALANRYRVPVLGAFVTPVVLVSLAASLAFTKSSDFVPVTLRSLWFPLHLGFAITADALFAIAGAASFAYLVQERLLRRKKLGTAFRALPPLHVLDDISHRTISAGFLFMTAGMAAGSIFAQQAWGSMWSWDPRQTWSLLTWLLFAGLLHARISMGWQGRRSAYFVLLATAAVLLSILGLGVLTETRHAGEFR